MSEENPSYAIRFRRQARLDIDALRVHLAEMTGEDHADDWHDELLDTLAALATFPKRWPLAEESRWFREEVRVMPYRHSPGSAAYQVFFTAIELEEDSPSVYILHVRHASRRPMTRAEARKIEAE